jgi:hypothetical protein
MTNVKNPQVNGIYGCFSDKKNPVSGVNCKETFKGISTNAEPVQMPDDPVAQLYFASLAIVGIYIFYRVMKKSK